DIMNKKIIILIILVCFSSSFVFSDFLFFNFILSDDQDRVVHSIIYDTDELFPSSNDIGEHKVMILNNNDEEVFSNLYLPATVDDYIITDIVEVQEPKILQLYYQNELIYEKNIQECLNIIGCDEIIDENYIDKPIEEEPDQEQNTFIRPIYFLALFLIIIVVILVYFGYYHKSDERVMSYVKKLTKLGYHLDHIKDKLIQSGWTRKYVEKIMRKIK
ncbi:hypothetical protein ACFL1H_00150, partial [Nanoarchaeota archaeon]